MMSKQIYIIDDNNLVCEAIQFLFESLNYKVKSYYNPLTFLEQDTSQLAGCVIVDLFMPPINGVELIRRLRKTNSTIGIIVISGNSSSETADLAIQEGAQAFLTKPFDTNYLIGIVSQILAKQY